VYILIYFHFQNKHWLHNIDLCVGGLMRFLGGRN